MAYAGLLFRTLMIGLTGAQISASNQPALMSVLLFASTAAGFAATRTSSFIAGTLYSSVQHIAFMLSILVVSYNLWFGTTMSVVYFVFYALTAFFFILLFGFVGSRGSGVSGTLVGVGRFVICALALSLAGIPPFMGFYLKLFLFTVLSSHSLWFAVGLLTLGSIYTFIFYGRVL